MLLSSFRNSLKNTLFLILLGMLISCVPGQLPEDKKEGGNSSSSTQEPPYLNDVFCVDANDCWIVGSQSILLHNTSGSLNGWRKVDMPKNTSYYLNSITCTSFDNCYMTGGEISSTPSIKGVLYRNTTGNDDDFFDVTYPFSFQSRLVSMECSNPNYCWAINGHGHLALNTTGDDSQWQESSINPHTLGVPWDVYCRNSTDCWSLGSKLARNTTGNLDDWNIVTVANYNDVPASKWKKMTCPSANDCWLLGSQDIAHNTTGADNGFTVVNDPFGLYANYKTIFCNSSTDCWLGGSHGNPVGAALARNTTGVDNGFYLVDSPFKNSREWITSIYCTSATNCWLVGSQGSIAHNSTGADDGWELVEFSFDD